MFREKIFLNLKNVTFRHKEYKKLEDFLVQEYQFTRLEGRELKVSNSGLPNVVTVFSHNRFECNRYEEKVEMVILGNMTQEMDTIEEENIQFPIYTTKYEMIKFTCNCGFILQQLLDKLILDLGLDILSREWFFEKIQENGP